MTTISITKAISMMPEELQQLSLAELSELHNLLKDSKQKKALKKADIVGAILKAKIQEKKEAEKVEPKQEELVLVENSVKAPVKPKAEKKPNIISKPTPKLNKPSKAKVIEELKDLAGENDTPEPQEQPKSTPKPKLNVKTPKQETKAPEKKEEPKKEPSFKRPETEKVDITKLSREDLLLYVASLEQKTEKFIPVIDGTKTKLVRTEFENVKEIQSVLMKQPMSLYCYVDERFDDKHTQFLVLYANEEIIVMLDRTREKNTTITLKTSEVQGTTLKFPKDKNTYEYAFYIREKK